MLQTVGRYNILRPLGSGAMGSVYLAEDPLLNRQAAIKMVDLAIEEGSQREFLRERLLRDAKAAALLSHANIVGVYDIIEQDNAAYVVMEYVAGESLASYLNRVSIPDMSFTIPALRQIASGLDYTHSKGIIHRDIKPANLMYQPSGEVKILDFGIARIGDGRTSTPAGMVIGTIEYMSPEQVKGETLDGRSDQFSLAALAYRMFTGSTLFGQHTLTTLAYKLVNEAPLPPTARNASLQSALNGVLAKALAKSPADRFENCSQFVAALEAAVAPARRPSEASTQLAAAPVRKRFSVGWLAIAASLFVVVVLGIAWKPWNHSQRVPEALPPHPDSVAQTVLPTPPLQKETPPTNTGTYSTPGLRTVPLRTKPHSLDSKTGAATSAAHDTSAQLAEVTRIYSQGQDQIGRRDFVHAIQSFTAAIRINPNLQKAYYSRGYVYQQSDQPDAALKDYSRAIDLNPNDALAYVHHGVCSVRTRQDQVALADFNRALELNPQLPAALNGRGGIFFRRHNYARAIDDFDAALRLNPRFAQAYANRARAKRALGDNPGADADARSARELKDEVQ